MFRLDGSRRDRDRSGWRRRPRPCTGARRTGRTRRGERSRHRTRRHGVDGRFADGVVTEIAQAGGTAVADLHSVADPEEAAKIVATALDALRRRRHPREQRGRARRQAARRRRRHLHRSRARHASARLDLGDPLRRGRRCRRRGTGGSSTRRRARCSARPVGTVYQTAKAGAHRPHAQPRAWPACRSRHPGERDHAHRVHAHDGHRPRRDVPRSSWRRTFGPERVAALTVVLAVRRRAGDGRVLPRGRWTHRTRVPRRDRGLHQRRPLPRGLRRAPRVGHVEPTRCSSRPIACRSSTPTSATSASAPAASASRVSTRATERRRSTSYVTPGSRAECSPTVDHERLTGDERRAGAGEEHHGRPDVAVGVAVAVNRALIERRLVQLRVLLGPF